MFSSKHYINIISLVITGLIAFIFSVKYSEIYFHSLFLVPTIYIVLFFVSIYLFESRIISRAGFVGNTAIKTVIILLIVLSIVYVVFVPRAGEVGRYPAIVDWIELFLSGKLPYNSIYTPSAFPFLFFLAMPFYFMGNAGLLEPLGLLLFFWSLLIASRTLKEKSVRLLTLLLTPVIYYGLLVRCELFTNVVLAVVVILLAEKFVNPSKKDFNFFITAVLFGLVLSTRSVIGIVYIIYLLYFFRSNLKHAFTFFSVTIIVFLAALLPFVLWDINDFLKNGPFAIQSYLSYLPFWNVIVFLVVSIYIGWMVRSLQEVFFASGIILFLIVMLSFIYKIFEFGFYTALIEDKFDPSYLIFSIPFFILSIEEYKIGRFTGRILS